MKQRNRSPTTKASAQRFAVTALRFIAVYIVLFSIAQYVSFLITAVSRHS